MIKVKVKERRMKWLVIKDRSSQQQPKQRLISTWPQIWSKSVEISVNHSNANAPLMRPSAPHSRSHQGIFISLISAIVLPIGTIFGDILVGFKDYFSVLNDDFDFELEYDLRGVLSSHTNNTTGAPGYTQVPGFNLFPTGVGLAEFGDLGCDLCAVLSARAIVSTATTVTVANKSGSNGPYTQTHTQTQQHRATPAIDRDDKLSLTGVGLHDFDINVHLFDVVFNQNELEYDLNNMFHIYLNENYYDNNGIAN